MSLNKEKVNEILADMKEQERKKQEAIEAEVDKFLENRLEYYVAMVMNGNIYNELCLMGMLYGDDCNFEFETKDKINKALEEVDWYLCLAWEYSCDLRYMHITDAPIDIFQPTNVEERQIKLGLRGKSIEVERASHKTSGGNIIVISIVIVVALILVAIACTH